MAHLRRRQLASGKVSFQVRWTKPDGGEDSKQFPPGQYEAAKKFKADLEHSLVNDDYVDMYAGRVKFRDYANRWLSLQITRISTQRNNERMLRLHVYPLIGDRSVSSIRRSDVLALVKVASAELSPVTLSLVVRLLASVMSAAVSDRMISRSPVQEIPLPKVLKKKVVIPTTAQVESISNALSAPWSSMVLVASMTGLRAGELMGMTLESTVLLQRETIVRPDLGQMLRPQNGLPARLGPPKTEASARTVPLSGRCIRVLAAHLAARPALVGDGFGGLLWQSTVTPGLPPSYSSLSQTVGVELRRHGLPAATGMHVFRHYFASALIAAGVDPKTIQRVMGHATMAETMDTYGHLWPEADEKVRKAIDLAFSAPVDAEERAR